MFRKLITLFLLTILPKLIFGQLTINCCDIKQVIPVFKNDSVASFNDKQLLVKFNVLPDLQKISTPLEIRVFSYHGLTTFTLVLRCYGKKITVDRYNTFLDGSTTTKDSSYKNVGEKSKGIYLFVKHTQGVSKKLSLTWNEFFRQLIRNHFYDLPQEKEIIKSVLQVNPNASSETNDGLLYFESKVGSHYRNVMYSTLFSKEAKKVKSVSYQLNIMHLLSQLY